MTVPRLPFVLSLVVVVSCGQAERTSSLVQPIYGGDPSSEDRAVVAVVNFAGGQCSGSLLAPTLVLTARHCVAGTGTEKSGVICGRTRFEPPDSAGALFVVAQATITEDEDDYLAVTDIRMPEDTGDDLCGTDVVLLHLAEPLSDIAPLEPRLDAGVLEDEVYSAVGFGVDAALEGEPSGARKRLDDLHVECRGDACDDPDVRDNEWVGSGGPCSGDSGGPALDAEGRVIGVVSRGKDGCTEPVFGDLSTRADWLRAEALQAAQRRGDPPPPWAPCRAEAGCHGPEASVEEGPAESCAIARGKAGHFSAAIALLAAVALRLRRSRARR